MSAVKCVGKREQHSDTGEESVKVVCKIGYACLAGEREDTTRSPTIAAPESRITDGEQSLCPGVK